MGGTDPLQEIRSETGTSTGSQPTKKAKTHIEKTDAGAQPPSPEVAQVDGLSGSEDASEYVGCSLLMDCHNVDLIEAIVLQAKGKDRVLVQYADKAREVMPVQEMLPFLLKDKP